MRIYEDTPLPPPPQPHDINPLLPPSAVLLCPGICRRCFRRYFKPEQLAEKLGTYETYAGSPASEGILQFDMWGVTPSDRWDWAGLKVSLK